jgi:hypothetical protein
MGLGRRQRLGIPRVRNSAEQHEDALRRPASAYPHDACLVDDISKRLVAIDAANKREVKAKSCTYLAARGAETTRTRPCPAAAPEPGCEDWATPVWLGASVAAAPAGGAGRGDRAPLDDPDPDTAASNGTMRRGGAVAVLEPDGPASPLGGGAGV